MAALVAPLATFVAGLACARLLDARRAARLRADGRARAAAGGEADDDDDDDSSDEDDGAGALKMVLVVRNDLKMTKGKIAAQACHGALGAYQMAVETCPEAVVRWERTGCAKVALRVEEEAGLLGVRAAARAARLPHYLVVDAGRTQIDPGSKTVCAVGPAPIGAIDKITGHLKLL